MENSSDSINENYSNNYTEKPSYSTAIETSRFKVIASQCFGVVAANLFKFSFGSALGFTAILIAELYKEQPEINVSINELSWFSSHCFMIPIGSIAGGFLAQYFGPRIVFLTSGVFYSVSWLIFYWAKNSAMLLLTQSLIGFTGGITKGPCYTYVAEVTEPRLRGTLMATTNLFYLSGHFFSVSLRSLVHWRTIAIVNLSFPILGFIMMCFMPESPRWLASENRIHDAELSLAWFRGWANPESVKPEFLSLLDRSTSILVIDDADNQKNSSKKLNRPSRTITPYLRRSFYIPLLTMCYIFFINEFGGVTTLMVFSIVVFEEIQSPIDGQVASTILSGIRFLGCISSILMMHSLGKQKLSLLSLLGAGVSLGLAATFSFLISQQILVLDTYVWIPTICFFIDIFVLECGIDTTAFLLNSEIFPTDLRHIGAGIGHLISNIYAAILSKSFLYMIHTVTMPGIFAIFATVSIFGTVSFRLMVPETENKSLNEIEEYYKDSHKPKEEKLERH